MFGGDAGHFLTTCGVTCPRGFNFSKIIRKASQTMQMFTKSYLESIRSPSSPATSLRPLRNHGIEQVNSEFGAPSQLNTVAQLPRGQ